MAFAFGILSAASLPLGTLAILVWSPNDRAVGVLTAFGGGALLAALTIDLVASAPAKAHFEALVVGCTLGGIAFVVLDQAVNNRGGFLRKSSTVIQYLRRMRRERFKRAIGELERIGVLQDLSSEQIEDLASMVVHENFRMGATIYSAGDPSDFFYILEKGEITRTDHRAGRHRADVLGAGSSFGWRAFITGSPHAFNAVATAESDVWLLPRDDFDQVLEASATLAESLLEIVSSQAITEYLESRQGLTTGQIAEWRENAVGSLRGGEAIPNAVAVDRHRNEFVRISDGIRRMPIFRGLSADELRSVADRLFCVLFERGDMIFRRGDPADRLYIVESGQVARIDPSDTLGRRLTMEDGEAFGGKSFITSAHRAKSAIATVDSELWVLRKSDFDVLIGRNPDLHRRVRKFLEGEEISRYLESKHGFDPQKAARRIRHATRNVDSGRLIPSVTSVIRQIGQHRGAPMAIWLGIMLDGIPESLVVGSSMIHAQVSMSLIAGLFLSNYPEALSSSVGMRQQGMSFARVLFMWSSRTLFTGIGAALGNVFFRGRRPGRGGACRRRRRRRNAHHDRADHGAGGLYQGGIGRQPLNIHGLLGRDLFQDVGMNGDFGRRSREKHRPKPIWGDGEKGLHRRTGRIFSHDWGNRNQDRTICATCPVRCCPVSNSLRGYSARTSPPMPGISRRTQPGRQFGAPPRGVPQCRRALSDRVRTTPIPQRLRKSGHRA